MDLMELLKNIFGEETLTFDQFAEKLNGAENIKLGNLADGAYVDKSEFDDVSSQLATANENLKDYDPEWKTKLEQAQADGEKKLNDYKFEQSVDKAINDSGAADLVSVKANLDMGLITQDKDGKIAGLDEQLENLKKEKPFLFKSEDSNTAKLNLGGTTPGTKKSSSMGSIKAAVKEKYANE